MCGKTNIGGGGMAAPGPDRCGGIKPEDIIGGGTPNSGIPISRRVL
jgi:hypothetical protein